MARLPTLFDPGLIERGVLHALAARHEITVDDVNGAVGALSRRGVVVGTLFAAFQVPRPFPRLALIVGQRHRQAVASALRVVIDQEPAAACQPKGIQPGGGVR